MGSGSFGDNLASAFGAMAEEVYKKKQENDQIKQRKEDMRTQFDLGMLSNAFADPDRYSTDAMRGIWGLVGERVNKIMGYDTNHVFEQLLSQRDKAAQDIMRDKTMRTLLGDEGTTALQHMSPNQWAGMYASAPALISQREQAKEGLAAQERMTGAHISSAEKIAGMQVGSAEKLHKERLASEEGQADLQRLYQATALDKTLQSEEARSERAMQNHAYLTAFLERGRQQLESLRTSPYTLKLSALQGTLGQLLQTATSKYLTKEETDTLIDTFTKAINKVAESTGVPGASSGPGLLGSATVGPPVNPTGTDSLVNPYLSPSRRTPIQWPTQLFPKGATPGDPLGLKK